MGPVCLREGVLGSQQPLCSRAVPLAFGILLEGVRDGDGPVAQVLSIHGLNGGVGGIEAGEVDEGVALGVARVGVPHDLRGLQDDSKGAEGVVQQLLVDLRVQVADEDVGAHVQVLVVGRGLVHADRLPVQLDHVHDFNGVVCIFLAEEFHEPITLMLTRDSIFGHVGIDHRSRLQKELP